MRRFRKSTKIIAIVVSVALILLSFAIVYFSKNNNKGKMIFYESYSKAQADGLVVSLETCSGYSGKPYTVSTSKYGLLCTGNAYFTEEAAIANPLEIKSAGNTIIVTLNGITYEIRPGESRCLR